MGGLDSLRLVTGVSAPTEDVVVVGDAVALSDTEWLVAVGSMGAMLVVGDVRDVTGTEGGGNSTGTDELPHATIPSNVDREMDPTTAR